jgi:hypothetical protein
MSEFAYKRVLKKTGKKVWNQRRAADCCCLSFTGTDVEMSET